MNKFRCKPGIILIVLLWFIPMYGMAMLSSINDSDDGNKLIAQNTEQETQTDSVRSKLEELNEKCNAKIITIEMADKMLNDAKSISINELPDGQGGLSDEQGEMLLNVYKKVADVYAANYHFKPAYLVYDEYVKLKNSFLEIRKSRRLETIQMETNQLKNENKLKISANEGQLTDLQSTNESLLASKLNVYRTIWIIVLIVAFCSGAIIWYFNNKYNRAKEKITQNRNRMMETAFISAIGEFGYEAAKNNSISYFSNMDQLKADVFKLCDSTLPSQSKGAERLKSLLSELKRAITKL